MVSERYTEVEKPLSLLLEEIKIGQIGLPDLQRPYVWTDAKVRNLLDSLIKGFHIILVVFIPTTDYEIGCFIYNFFSTFHLLCLKSFFSL